MSCDTVSVSTAYMYSNYQYVDSAWGENPRGDWQHSSPADTLLVSSRQIRGYTQAKAKTSGAKATTLLSKAKTFMRCP